MTYSQWECYEEVRGLTDRNPRWQLDPIALGVCANQLLPHEEDGRHVQGRGHKLVDDHKNDGDIPCSAYGHHTIYIACKSGHLSFSCQGRAGTQ